MRQVFKMLLCLANLLEIEAHTIRVARIVVVGVAVAIHIVEVSAIVDIRRTKPPVGSARNKLQDIT